MRKLSTAEFAAHFARPFTADIKPMFFESISRTQLRMACSSGSIAERVVHVISGG